MTGGAKPTGAPAAVKSTPKLVGTYKLLASSLRFWRHYWRILGLVGLVAASVNLLLGLLLSAPVSSVYKGLWFGFVSCSYIWTLRHAGTNININARNSYWQGTAPVLKFYIALAILALAFIPFSIGAFVYLALRTVISNSFWSQTAASLLWLGLALISLMLLARLISVIMLVTLPDIAPLTALRLSWRASKKRTGAILVRVVLFFVYLAPVLAAAGFILVKLGSSGLGQILAAVFGYVLLAPLGYIYLFKLYQELTFLSRQRPSVNPVK